MMMVAVEFFVVCAIIAACGFWLAVNRRGRQTVDDLQRDLSELMLGLGSDCGPDRTVGFHMACERAFMDRMVFTPEEKRARLDNAMTLVEPRLPADQAEQLREIVAEQYPPS
jgi:hypothetical protein